MIDSHTTKIMYLWFLKSSKNKIINIKILFKEIGPFKDESTDISRKKALTLK